MFIKRNSNYFSLICSSLATIALIFLLLFTLPTWSLDSDQKLPLNITSDWWQYNRNTGVAIYKGTVNLIQGTTHLTADQLTVYLDKQNKLVKAIAVGSPAHYNTIMDQGKPPVFAQAKEMDYLINEHKIILIGQAQVIQGQDKFTGAHVEYDTLAKVITTTPEHHERTTIIIQPQQDNMLEQGNTPKK